jgi:hypothetical protein
MTGKEKLIEWIKNADAKTILNKINEYCIRDIRCPDDFGLQDHRHCGSGIDCVTKCWQQALEKEYAEVEK